MGGVIIMDVEGVLVPRKAILMLKLAKELGIIWLLKNVFRGLLYQLRILSLERTIKGFYEDLRGIKLDTLWRAYSSKSLHERLRLIRKISKGDYRLVLISSGIPQSLVDELGTIVAAEAAYGVKLLLDEEGRIRGLAESSCIKKHGKRKLARMHIRNKDRVIVVADDWNNLQLRNLADEFIGFNPDDLVASKADVIIEGKRLEGLVRYITEGTLPRPSPKRELFRKSLHLAGALIIPLATLVGFHALLMLIILSISGYIIMELARTLGVRVPVFTQVVENACRGRELDGLAMSPVFYAMGLFTLMLLPPPFLYAPIIALTVGDGIAGLVHSFVRGHRYPHNKARCVEGTIAGFLISLLLSTCLVPFNIAIASAIPLVLLDPIPPLLNDDLMLAMVEAVVSFVLMSLM